MSKMHIDKNTPADELTPGGIIYQAGNAREFKTGDWRSVKPIFLSEKCKQCGLCFPVCPDDACNEAVRLLMSIGVRNWPNPSPFLPVR